MENQEKFEPGDEIVKVTIPDEDVSGWIESLSEGGFTAQELDDFLSRMNATYKKAKDINFIKNELKKLQQHFLEKYGRVLTKTEIEHLKQGIESRSIKK